MAVVIRGAMDEIFDILSRQTFMAWCWIKLKIFPGLHFWRSFGLGANETRPRHHYEVILGSHSPRAPRYECSMASIYASSSSVSQAAASFCVVHKQRPACSRGLVAVTCCVATTLLRSWMPCKVKGCVSHDESIRAVQYLLLNNHTIFLPRRRPGVRPSWP
jgi:hypothetical protein